MKKGSNKTMFCLTKGFTLIELLVTVLIIGLLAAVALPQYQKAVKKAQGAEVLAALDALDKNLSAYYLEHDTYRGGSAEKFSIDVPQLHHFKYAVVVNSKNVGNASFELTSQLIVFDTTAQIDIVSSDGIRVVGLWKKGKSSSWQCMNITDSPAGCQDYFNCGGTPRVQFSSDMGGGNIYQGWGGGHCDLPRYPRS